MSTETILGTTTLTDRQRISLIKAVREAMEAAGYELELGDQLVYKQVNGDVVLEPAKGRQR